MLKDGAEPTLDDKIIRPEPALARGAGFLLPRIWG